MATVFNIKGNTVAAKNGYMEISGFLCATEFIFPRVCVTEICFSTNCDNRKTHLEALWFQSV
jgi:hypothetical protein